jgi:hypothetical protein
MHMAIILDDRYRKTTPVFWLGTLISDASGAVPVSDLGVQVGGHSGQNPPLPPDSFSLSGENTSTWCHGGEGSA